MKIQIALSLILLFLFASCQRSNKSHLLNEAEKYVRQYHDSTLILLEKLNPEKLNQDELARYYLIQNMVDRFDAKRKVSDSTLLISQTYFESVNDQKNLAEILLLQGWAAYSDNRYPEAESKYKQSLSKWLQLNDSSRVIRTYRELSWVSDRSNKNSEAINYLNESLKYSNRVQRIYVLFHLGNKLSEQNDLTNAIYFYKKAYDNAFDTNNRYMYQTICNRMVQLYIKNEMYEKAFHALDTFRKMKKGRYETSYSTLSRADIYKKTHQYDSAFYYYTLASQSLNAQVAAEANSELASLYQLNGDYKSAVSALQNFAGLWVDNTNRLEGNHMKEKYDEMKLKNELNEIKLAKRNRELYMLLLFIIIFILVITTYIIYLRNKKNKEQQRLKQQAEILEKENRLLKQAEELSTLREKESGLREALFKKMTVFHKIPSLENGNQKQNEDKRIILSDKDWEELIQIVNSSYDGFADRLKERFPLLSPKDIQFCCLVKINVTLKDLSDIYCVSKSAITKKKFRLKTEKLNFSDADKSLDDFLDNF